MNPELRIERPGVQLTADDLAQALGQMHVQVLILQKRIKQLEEELAKAKP